MTIFSFPAILPSRSSFELVSNTKSFRSPLTNSVQTSSRKGSLWKVTLAFDNLFGDERAIMQAFLAKLNGQEHRFYLHDHAFVRRGNGGGNLKINGGGQGGSTIDCDGASTSVSDYLMAGDYISFNNELHMITDDADSDGSGEVTLSISPPIRKQTINNGAIDYAPPVMGVFILSSKAAWDNQPGFNSSFKIDAVEDVLA